MAEQVGLKSRAGDRSTRTHSLQLIGLCRVAHESASRVGETASPLWVTINDRGPFVRGRVVDLTPAAARAIGVSSLTHVSLTME